MRTKNVLVSVFLLVALAASLLVTLFPTDVTSWLVLHLGKPEKVYGLSGQTYDDVVLDEIWIFRCKDVAMVRFYNYDNFNVQVDGENLSPIMYGDNDFQIASRPIKCGSTIRSTDEFVDIEYLVTEDFVLEKYNIFWSVAIQGAAYGVMLGMIIVTGYVLGAIPTEFKVGLGFFGAALYILIMALIML